LESNAQTYCDHPITYHYLRDVEAPTVIDTQPTPTVGDGLPEVPTYPEFADLLRELRDRAGLTQGQAAERLKVSRPTFAQWEGGRHFPAKDKVHTLDDLLNGGGALIAAFDRARGSARLRPVDPVELTPVAAAPPLYQVFRDVRAAVMEQLCRDDEGRPLGWRHNLVPSSRHPPPSRRLMCSRR